MSEREEEEKEDRKKENYRGIVLIFVQKETLTLKACVTVRHMVYPD